MPTKIQTEPSINDIFAHSGNRRDIPDTKQSQGQANLADGFPPETMMRPTQGGVPPQGVDFNGILNLLSQFCFYYQSGGAFLWNSGRDYIKGCEVIGSDGVKYRCITASGVNYGGAKDPTVSGNAHRWNEVPNKPWLNVDSAYESAYEQATASGTPVGTVAAYAGSTAPAGWFLCDGSSKQTSSYPALYAVIGTTYGGTATAFYLPDLRGRFVRGLDTRTTGAVDQWYTDNGSARRLGSYQGFALENITGTVGEIRADDRRQIVGDVAGSYNGTNPFYQESETIPGETGFTSSYMDFRIERFDSSRAASTSSETRPVNLALNYIIKY